MKRVLFIILFYTYSQAISQIDSVVALDPSFYQIVGRNPMYTKVVGGLKFTEGPVWHPDGYLLFSDIPGNTIYKWDKKKLSVYKSPSLHSNGLTLDTALNVVVCEHSGRKVVRITKSGEMSVLASLYGGRRLNSPNDIVYHPSSRCYFFTDPPYGLKRDDMDSTKEQLQNHVYRTCGETITAIDSSLVRPNGVAISPDGKYLYVAQSEFEWLWKKYSLSVKGEVLGSEIFHKSNLITGNPDGVKVDKRGNVFATANHGVVVFDPKGKLLGYIVLPENTSNLCWGEEDMSTLYVTANTSVYKIPTKTVGFVPYMKK